MRKPFPLGRRAAIFLAILVFGNALILAAQLAGLRINTTASMPLGLYRIRPRGGEPLERGMLVAICPSENALAVAVPRRYLHPGPCDGDVEPLLKRIAAVGGDRVDVSDAGVIVNGEYLPNSGRVARDCARRPLPRIPAGRYIIAKGELWLYAPVGRSWDSRYFGPEPAANVLGLATPLIIVGEGRACT